MSRYQLLGILLLLLLPGRSFPIQSLAIPVGIEHPVRRNAPVSIQPCVLNGNSDLYGLGIRLGVYFQLISTLLANHFLPDTLREAWDANTIFLVSIFIAVIKSSVNVNSLAAPEAFIMLQMLFAYLVAVYHIGASFKWLCFEILSATLNGMMGPDPGWSEIMSELGQAQSNVSQLGTTMRQFLALAIASYNVWFWFPGNGFLDSDRHCNSSMFLFAQVDLHGNARIFFQVLGVLYLLSQVYKLTWNTGLTIFLFALWRWRVKKGSKIDFDEPKPTWRRFFTRLFDPTSRAEEEKARVVEEIKCQRKRISGEHDKRLYLSRIFANVWHTTTFAASLFFIAWSVAAIELTLIWNHAQGVYNLSSTGQLIPFTVGLAGLLKTVFSLFLIVWRKKMQKHEHEVKKDSAIWKYRLRDERCAVFVAKPPERRWSFDGRTFKDVIGPKKPKETRYDRLAPVYPILKEDQSTRLGTIPGVVKHEFLWDSSRWLYLTKEKHVHIFHNISIDRRKSLDDLEWLQRSQASKPHPARLRPLVPLAQKQEYEETELKRTHWYWNQRVKLGKALGNKKRSHKPHLWPCKSLESLDSDPDREAYYWLPDDIDAGSFSSLSTAASDTDADHPGPRRWSFDEKDSAYRDFGSPSRRYPFLMGQGRGVFPARSNSVLAESGVYFPNTDSRSTSDYSSESSVAYVRKERTRTSQSTSSSRSRRSTPLGAPSRERTRVRSLSPSPSRSRRSRLKYLLFFLVIIITPFVWFFNTLFLCAPFSALSRKYHKYQTARSISKQFPRTPSHIRTYPARQPVKFKYSSRSSRRRTRCKACDCDIGLYGRRRRWTRLMAEVSRNRSLERARVRYVFSPQYSADVVRWRIRPWVKGRSWWQKLRALWKYEFMAGLRQKEEDEERGRRRSDAEGRGGAGGKENYCRRSG